MKFFILSFLFALQSFASLNDLAVQDGGRIKPYDSFAKETLQLIYGKKTYNQKPATEIVLTWLLVPTVWLDQKIFELRNPQILEKLNLAAADRYYSSQQLFENRQFRELMEELKQQRASKEKLTPYFQALQRLESQFFVFREMISGNLLKLIPVSGKDSWQAVSEFPRPAQDLFAKLAQSFVQSLDKPEGQKQTAQLAQEFKTYARAQAPEKYPSDFRLQAEVHYNQFHPFLWASICYGLAAIFLMLTWVFGKSWGVKFGWFFALTAFALHTYGFVLRIFLAGRPPVSNMYESIVWVAWGTFVFSMILEIIYRRRFILWAGSLASCIALIIADQAPTILDSSIQPLEAVLRSNLWLTIHVLTITLSYAAFLLAFILGNAGLFMYAGKQEPNPQKVKPLVEAIYRSMQIGVGFLAPGIILGGIWADYSWGRFWGWDPKETWALIVLLGYIAVLHARISKWIQDFGTIAAAVVSFSLVIMAWYGVNYVLGAGLHSYGFGAGGFQYVGSFVMLEIFAVIYILLLRKFRLHKN